MVFCGKPSNAAGRPLGTRHRCFKKGVGVGIGIGEERGEVSGKAKGKKVGKVLGEVVGRKKGIKIGVRKLKLGNGLTLAELNSLSKDSLRNILSNRKKRGISSHTTSVSNLSKPALKNAVLVDLRRTKKLKLV